MTTLHSGARDGRTPPKGDSKEGLGHRGCCMCRSGDTGHQENISPSFPCWGWEEARKGLSAVHLPSGLSAVHLPSKQRSSCKHQSPAWWLLLLNISPSVSFSVLFIFSYKIMSKHPSALGMYSKAHGVFSPSQAQTKHERAPTSLLSLGTLQPQHSTRSCWDRCDSHPLETLPKVPRHKALPVAEKYCTISEAGDVLGRGCFQGLQQPGKHLLTPIPSKEELRVCILVSWLWNLADKFIFRKVSETRRIIMKKPKY